MSLEDWLCSVGLGRYGDILRANDVEFDVLETLNEVDLKELGFSLGDRKRLLQAISGRLPPTPPASTMPNRLSPAPVAERRQLTVMFVDLVGSTELSQRLDPEEMRDVLKAYQDAVVGEISRMEGFVAKLMGDGVLAYFGWPRTHEDEAERAIRAGTTVVASVSRLCAGGGALAARVGIATGLVVVGDLIGEGAAQEQAVVGETPNLAARLQSVAEPGTVVISDVTRRLVGDLFVLRDLGAQALKGIRERTVAFSVLGERTVASRFAAIQTGGTAPIVGRDQELALLLDCWRQATASEGRVVLLTGEAGIGKSRIVEALVQQIVGAPHALMRFQCSPYHSESALYPVLQQIGVAAGFSAEDDEERRLDRLEALFGQGIGNPQEAASLLSVLMGLDGTHRYGVLQMTPAQRRSRTLRVLADHLVGLAASTATLWIVEDAHWIDPSTLDLIEATLDRVRGTRLLALITARPAFEASFASHPRVTRVALHRLERAATHAIVTRLSHGKPFPLVVLNEITARTDGVPLFVEEITKAVLESGVLRETPDAYAVDGPINMFAIPATLHDTLMARLDRLGPVKEVAQLASVIGRSFDHMTVVALAETLELDVAEALHELTEAELVFRHGVPPEATYLFKHALVRDAAYESLLKRRRQDLHLRLLTILEGGTSQPELLAQHAQAGGDPGRAIVWWQIAAEQAVGRAAFEEAEAHLIAASAMLPSIADVARRTRENASIAVARAHTSLVQNGYCHDRTRELYEQADELAQAVNESRLFMLARYGIWVFHHSKGNARLALAKAEQLYETAAAKNEPQLLVMANRLLANSLTMAGRFEEAVLASERMRPVYDPERDANLAAVAGTNPLVSSNAYAAFATLAQGFPARARVLAEEAWDVARSSKQFNSMAYAMWHRAFLEMCMGEAALARDIAADLLQYLGSRDIPFWKIRAQVVCLWGRTVSEKTIDTIDEMKRSIDAMKTVGDGIIGPLSQAFLAEALAMLGNTEAFDLINETICAIKGSGARFGLAETHRREGLILRKLRPNDIAAAEAAFQRAIVTARDQGARFWELRACTDLAAVMTAAGRCHDAVALLSPVYSWFTEGFELMELKRAKATLNRIQNECSPRSIRIS